MNWKKQDSKKEFVYSYRKIREDMERYGMNTKVRYEHGESTINYGRNAQLQRWNIVFFRGYIQGNTSNTTTSGNDYKKVIHLENI